MEPANSTISLKRHSDLASSSPRKGSASSFIDHTTTNSGSGITTELLKDGYQGLVKYDDDHLLSHRFKISLVTPAVLDAVKVKAHVSILDEYIQQYFTKPRETSKYQPMMNYITTVVSAVHVVTEAPYHRQTITTAKTPTESDATLVNLRRPDFTTFDDQDSDHHYNFQYASAVWEVKVKEKDAPMPNRHRSIIHQVAGAIRLRMASRPFQLFTLAIILCDSRFWVSMWDRGGAVISKPHNLRTPEGRDVYLKVLISLHCYLDLYDLGLNQHVGIPNNLHYIPSNPFPTITFAGYEWQLIKRIFQSITETGRGTSVWHVQRFEDGKLFERAIKWSWRSSTRSSEAMIHREIEAAFQGNQPREIALLDHKVQSKDDGPEEVVDVDSLRSASSKPTKNLLLTCILLKRVGKPIWDYEDDQEILLGAVDMLQGVMALHDVGWMHRDLSPGNSLLTRDRENDGPSFISDLELAKEERSQTSREEISGTVQFMAKEIIRSLAAGKSHRHHFRHDLEAFVYVLVYAIMRKEIRSLYKHEREKYEAKLAGSSTVSQAESDKSDDDSGDDRDATPIANGQTRQAPYQVMTGLMDQLFCRTSYGDISAQRANMSEIWQMFMEALKGPANSDENPDAPRSILDYAVRRLLALVSKQNTAQSFTYSSFQSAKRAKTVPDTSNWLVSKDMLDILKEALEEEAAQ